MNVTAKVERTILCWITALVLPACIQIQNLGERLGEPLDAPDGSDANAADGSISDALDADAPDAAVDASETGNGDAAPVEDVDLADVRTATIATSEEATLISAQGSVDDELGIAVAISAVGDRALVGARYDDLLVGANAGSAHVFVRTASAWMEEATLLGGSNFANAYLGSSVALSADGVDALVGAPGYDGGKGTVLAYTRMGNQWSPVEVKPIESDPTDRFGESVAISADGTRALIGVPGDDTPAGVDAGSVRVMAKTATVWSEQAVLVASDAAPFDELGFSVAISGDGTRVLVGVQADGTLMAPRSGSARVFAHNGAAWYEEATLAASDAATNDRFGWSVSLSTDGARALVGVPNDNANAGSARVFVRTGSDWREEATLGPRAGAPGSYLGASVSLSGDGARALIGAPLALQAQGSAHVFVRSGSEWLEAATLVAFVGAPADELGQSVSLSTDARRALVGVYADDTAAGRNGGSARVFTLGP